MTHKTAEEINEFKGLQGKPMESYENYEIYEKCQFAEIGKTFEKTNKIYSIGIKERLP